MAPELEIFDILLAHLCTQYIKPYSLFFFFPFLWWKGFETGKKKQRSKINMSIILVLYLAQQNKHSRPYIFMRAWRARMEIKGFKRFSSRWFFRLLHKHHHHHHRLSILTLYLTRVLLNEMMSAIGGESRGCAFNGMVRGERIWKILIYSKSVLCDRVNELNVFEKR